MDKKTAARNEYRAQNWAMVIKNCSDKAVICRKYSLCLGYLAKLPVKPFNGVGRVNQPADFLREAEVGAEIRPVILPGGRNLRIFLVSPLSKSLQCHSAEGSSTAA